MSNETTVTPMGFGPYVRQLRDGMGWKQKQVAERIGVSQSHYSSIEAKSHLGYIPAPEIVAGLARVFRVSEADLLRAAGYLQDDIAMRRMDDRGNEWMEEQDRLASALGVEGLERVLERVRQEYIEEMSRESGTGRQMTFS